MLLDVQSPDCFSQWLHTPFDCLLCSHVSSFFLAYSSHCQGSKDKLGANRGRFQPKDKAGLVNFEEEQFLEVPWPNGAGPSMALAMISRGPRVA